MIKERLSLLREAMRKENIDVYYFNTSDYHMSEYVPEHFKTIAYFSGFSGSLATLLVTSENAYIFVDGRYHTQADKQCLENGVEVIKLGTSGALEPIDFIKKNYPKAIVGLDAKRTSIAFGKKLTKEKINIKSIDIYSDIIEDRPALLNNPIYELDEKYTGLSRKRKIELIKYCLNDKVHVVNNLESIAYLLNLRSNDIKYTPVFLSFLVFYEKEVYLFVDLNRFNENLLDRLYDDGIIIRPYNSYYLFLESIKNKKVILDEYKVNFESYNRLNKNRNKIYNMRSLIEDMKAIKNPIEQENIKLAHIYDGVALVRFMKWIDEIDKTTISEYDASEKLNNLRLEYKANDLSFNTIVAYNENAASMHYGPTKDNSAMLDNKGILLFDSGGQYNEGTTDVTRTISLGQVDDEVKMYFTLVLKSMFNLSEVKFLKGLSGNQLDILARKDLWNLGVDYRCGTGHGVGYNLAVHEAPPNIRYGKTEQQAELVEIKSGMLFSDEPGVYFENKYGIRCENLLLCKKAENNEYGQFLEFETVTLAPFDLRLIDKKYLDQKTIDVLNKYHQRVFDTLCPYLDEAEIEYLRKLTRAI